MGEYKVVVDDACHVEGGAHGGVEAVAAAEFYIVLHDANFGLPKSYVQAVGCLLDACAVVAQGGQGGVCPIAVGCGYGGYVWQVAHVGFRAGGVEKGAQKVGASGAGAVGSEHAAVV